MSLRPKRLSRTIIYENPWVNLYVDAVRFPDGRVIEQHHVLEFEKEAVAVVVIGKKPEKNAAPGGVDNDDN